MSPAPDVRGPHARGPYVRPVAKSTWYLRHGRYRSYMLRELTCVLVAIYCVLMLLAINALAAGRPEEWQDFLTGQQHTGWIVFHAFALLFFVAYQTVPWFRLAPKAMSLQFAGKVVPATAIVVIHYFGWIVVTAALFWTLGVI